MCMAGNDVDVVYRVARLCHEVNRVYCLSLGDASQLTWDAAPEWARASAISGVRAHIDDPSMTPEGSHALWCAHKLATGWSYGETKDAELLTHPCLVEWEELPDEQKFKDLFFHTIVRTVLAL